MFTSSSLISTRLISVLIISRRAAQSAESSPCRHALGIQFEAAQNRLLPVRLGAFFSQGGRLRLQLRHSLSCSAMSRLKLCLIQVSVLVEIQHPGDAAPQLEDLLADLLEPTGLLGRRLFF